MNRLALACTILLTLGCEGLGADDADATSGQTTSGGSGSCVSDVTVGTGAPNASGQLGAACSPSGSPANCIDGTFVRFGDTNECICIARCSTVNVGQGGSCDGSGLYVCQTVSGVSGGPYCMARSWDVCGDSSGNGGTGGTNGGEGTDGTTGGDGGDGTDGSQCKPNGLPCDDDAECCSLTCFSDGCG